MENFSIHFEKFNELSDKATDWLINSWKFKPDSLEWQICRLKRKIYMRDALKELRKAKLCLN